MVGRSTDTSLSTESLARLDDRSILESRSDGEYHPLWWTCAGRGGGGAPDLDLCGGCWLNPGPRLSPAVDPSTPSVPSPANRCTMVSTREKNPRRRRLNRNAVSRHAIAAPLYLLLLRHHAVSLFPTGHVYD